MAAQPSKLLQKDIGAKVKSLREEQGYSQELLAGLAGLTKGAIVNIETGKKMPRGDTLVALAFALGARVDDLLPTDYSPYVEGSDRFQGLMGGQPATISGQGKKSPSKGMPTRR